MDGGQKVHGSLEPLQLEDAGAPQVFVGSSELLCTGGPKP